MLDRFVLKDRSIALCPDSDAWRDDKLFDILAGFFSLAMWLKDEGARVQFIRLPNVPGVAKTGLDDWLKAEGSLWQHACKHL